MVYQHFTLVPAMTVAENFVLARDDVPAVIDWRASARRWRISVAHAVPRAAQRQVSAISAGERQKCEILKQLYLERRFLILDEPTSVLTPHEADEMLGMLRDMVAKGDLTILMITHKFREVMAFADEVTVLRRGKLAGAGHVEELTPDAMARTMIGAEELTVQPARTGEFGAPRLDIEKLTALDDGGQPAVRDVSLSCAAARSSASPASPATARASWSRCSPASARRERGDPRAGRALSRDARGDAAQSPLAAAGGAAEERLRRAHERRRQYGVPRVRPPAVRDRRLVAQSRGIPRDARRKIARYRIKTRPTTPIGALSGGNVQRAVLARELAGEVDC